MRLRRSTLTQCHVMTALKVRPTTPDCTNAGDINDNVVGSGQKLQGGNWQWREY